MVSVLASSVVDRGFKPRSGQTKDYKIGICCFSTKHAALRRKSKEWFGIGIRILCPSVATCLSANCCFSELALYKNPTKRVGLAQSRPHHHLIENVPVLATI
jgi:hypothetical protein